MIDYSKQLAKYFDHTLLKLGYTQGDLGKLCEEANRYKFHSVVVYPADVSVARMSLIDEIKVATVIGFPHGKTDLEVKEAEIVIAGRMGAEEVDIVIDYSLLKEGHEEPVQEEIRRLVDVTKREKLVSKIIVETSQLTDSLKIDVLRLCEEAETDFIKTSTGFSQLDSNIMEDVRIFNEHRKNISIKASSGIRTLEQCLKLIQLGADRIGTSSAVDIMEEFNEKQNTENIINLSNWRQ